MRTAVVSGLLSTIFLAVMTAAAQQNRLQSNDYFKLRSVGEVRFAPDGSKIAYTVMNSDQPGRTYPHLWIIDVASGQARRLGKDQDIGGNPTWSPDGQWIAFEGSITGRNGLAMIHPDGTGETFLADESGTNSPLPEQGVTKAWSPDSKQIAFVSATTGPETADATGDPMVITRYLYKPVLTEGMTRFNDNRRLHLFVVDISTKQVRQLTDGIYDEHSIGWSPDGQELVFVSNREPNPDQFFNYDLFTLKLSDRSIRRLTATESAEYEPRWSPDGKRLAYLGTRRGLTDRETTMEDTHVWIINADGSGRREIGAAIDARQHNVQWSPDGRSLYFMAQQRGSLHLVHLQADGGRPEAVVSDSGLVLDYSLARNGAIAYAFAGLRDLPELFLKTTSGTKQLTNLNAGVFNDKEIAAVESFTFLSNDSKYEVEAFLTRPIGLTETSKYPLIVNIHGGPHGENGPAFNFHNQVYAARGWAVLNVNYRGSTGYGQAFADLVFGDQDGNEAQDVLYGTSAALRRYLWLDRERMGIEGVSYGGQLTEWLITQTRMFKAAVPLAGITNLVSYNYTTYYNQYEQMEFGQLPHQGDLMNMLWDRSALKHVAAVATPTMILHGENDSDVPITEAEQYYIALQDVGVETVFVRYPREGHGLRESRHIVDSLDRSIEWYEKHFPQGEPVRSSAAVP